MGFDESSLHEKCAFSLHVSLQQQQQQRHNQQVQQGGAGGSIADRDGASGGTDASEVRWNEVGCCSRIVECGVESC